MWHRLNTHTDKDKKKSFFNFPTEHKIIIGIGFTTVVLMAGGIFLASSTGPSNKPLMGKNVPISGEKHFPDGTQITYDTNPPAEGNHYPEPKGAGIYTTPPADGNLVHSLEHGAVILWYNPKLLSVAQIGQLKDIYSKAPGDKDIMVARVSMDVPVALTSWGRILKLKTIDKKIIDEFFSTNIDRGPESAPI